MLVFFSRNLWKNHMKNSCLQSGAKSLCHILKNRIVVVSRTVVPSEVQRLALER